MEIFEYFGIWIITATLGVTLAAPLGPINLEMIKHALNTSVSRKFAWMSAVLIGIGAMTGDFLIALTALTIGGEVLSSFFSNPILKLALFTINLGVLSYLGFSTLLKPSINPNESIKIRSDGNLNHKTKNYKFFLYKYITGLSIVVTSPWTYLWWTSAGTIILFSKLNFPDLFSRLIIVLMFLSGIFLWVLVLNTTLAVIGKTPNRKFILVVTKGSAFILLIFAFVILINMFEVLIIILKL
ncbi:LysE family transporter [Candidatus Hodarchaeum mangrovi]